jgi:hypothetical protein
VKIDATKSWSKSRETLASNATKMMRTLQNFKSKQATMLLQNYTFKREMKKKYSSKPSEK